MDLPLDDGTISDFKIVFSTRRLHAADHYRALQPADKRRVDLRLEQLERERIRDPEIEADFEAELGCKMGFNATALGRSYGLRDVANIGYYHRAMDRGVDKVLNKKGTPSLRCPPSSEQP